MITFPLNPAFNESFTSAGRSWKWNGTAWQALPLPTEWSDIANKPASFPSSVHSHEIADVSGLANALDGKQAAGSYQPAGIYATLDLSGKVPSNQLPSFVDDVLEFADITTFPSTGETGKIYVSLDSGKTYRWSGSVYVEISASPGSSDSVPEGTLNLYHTNLRAAAAAPVQSVCGKTGVVTLVPSDIQGLNSVLVGSAAMTSNFTVRAVSQGTYQDGSTIAAGTSLEEVIKNMLQTVVPATYMQPTLSLTTSAQLSLEIGSSVSATLSATWVQNDAGPESAFRIKRDGTTLQSGALPSPHAANFTISANTSFTAEADYGPGPQKTDNMGSPSGTPIPVGTKISGTITFQAKRMSFYGADTTPSIANTSASIRALGNTSLGLANGATFTVSIPAGTRRVTIAYPATLRALTSVSYVEAGNASVKDTFASSNVTVEGAAGFTAESYRVYSYVPSIPFGSAATYIVTI